MVKLIAADASPFARKARVVIAELGLQEHVDVVNPGAVTPVSNNDDLNKLNPLGMIPALETDDGTVIVDSPVICEYLNELGMQHGAASLFPTDANRLHVASQHAMADGIMDVAVGLRYETALRPAELQWPDWIDHQKQKIGRALDYFENSAASLKSEPDIAVIAIASALGYLDFRFNELNWREGRPLLAAWFEKIGERSSFKTTEPA